MGTSRPTLLFLSLAACLGPIPFAASATIAQNQASSATLRGSIENPSCARLRLGDSYRDLDAEGRFEVVLPIESARYIELECGTTLELFLTPGDDLAIDWRSSAVVASGRGCEANNFLIESNRLYAEQEPQLLPTYYRLVAQSEVPFVAGMQALADQAREPLEHFLATQEVDPKFAKVERAKLIYPHAQGLLGYALLHPQISGDYAMVLSDGFYDFLEELDLNDAELLEVESYRAFLDAYVSHRGRELMSELDIFQQGDNRQTRARYEVAVQTFREPSIRDRALHGILSNHLENLGPKNLTSLMERFVADCTSEVLTGEVEAQYRAELARREGHPIEVYKTVDGEGLEAHILLPPGHSQTDRRPAYLWFHGAGWQYGQWWWCFACEHHQENGMVVVGIEYRLYNRFGSTVLESIADAKSAVRWVRANAERLGVDADRIAVAGFSAGAHLAAATALLADPEMPGDDPDPSAMPNAILIYSGPMDLVRDPWVSQQLAGRTAMEEVSPLHQVRAGQPPTLLVHGTNDELCSFPDAVRFAEAMGAAGNRCELVPLPGSPHEFFQTEARTEALKATDKFLRSIGFLDEDRN